MQINESFWGGADKTTTQTGGYKTTSYNLLEAYNNGDLPFNEELDISISPWAINKNADFLQLCYGLSYKTGNNTWANPKFYPIFDLDAEPNGVPFYFMLPDYTTYASCFDWYCRNGYNQANMATSSWHAYIHRIKPIREFDYNKFCYWVGVLYANSDTISDISASEMDVYFNHDLSWLQSHPIVALRIVPYYIGADSQNPTTHSVVRWFANCLAKQKPLTDVATDPLTGYNIPFIDNFMCILPNGSGSANPPQQTTIGCYKSIRIWKEQNWDHVQIYSTSYSDNANGIILNSDFASTQPNEISVAPTNENRQSKWTIRSYWNGQAGQTNGRVYYRTELNVNSFANADDMKDYLYKQLAYIGTWINLKASDMNTVKGSNNSWLLGEIDKNGVTTGKYKIGTATAEYDNSSWQNPWNDSPYQGRGEDPTQYDDTQTSNITTVTGDQSYGTHEYLMTENAINQLLRVLNEYKLFDAQIETPICELFFGDSDPLKCIVSVIKYPFDIIKNFVTNGIDTIIQGTGIQNNKLPVAYIDIPVSIASTLPQTPTERTIDLTSANEIIEINWQTSSWKYGTAKIPYFAKFKNFLDYEPYSIASLYIPFCGSVKIDPELYIGHNIGVDYIISPLDGTCKAFIKRDNIVVDTLTGNIGNSIEIYSNDEVQKMNTIHQLNATIQAQKMNTVKKWASVGIGVVGGAVMGGGIGAAVGAVGSVTGAAIDTATNNISIEEKKFDIATAETPFKQLQTGGGFLSSCDEYAVRLVIYRPETLDGYTFDNWSDYGHVCGFATYMIDKIENYSGYLECSNIVLDNMSATKKEKEIIYKLLQGGVFV